MNFTSFTTLSSLVFNTKEKEAMDQRSKVKTNKFKNNLAKSHTLNNKRN